MLHFQSADDDRIKDRISKRVSITERGCWQWQGTANGGGYGLMCYQGKSQSAHRVSFMVFNGPIPEGLHVMHICDNPGCVNPDHLLVGTAKENRADCKNKGRLNAKRGSENGFAKLTEEEVLEIRTSDIGPRELAKKFGLHEGSVCNIRRGLTWKHVGNIRMERGQARGSASVKAKLTEADVLAIRASSDKQSVLAKRFGVDASNIRMILSGRSWKHLLANTELGAF